MQTSQVAVLHTCLPALFVTTGDIHYLLLLNITTFHQSRCPPQCKTSSDSSHTALRRYFLGNNLHVLVQLQAMALFQSDGCSYNSVLIQQWMLTSNHENWYFLQHCQPLDHGFLYQEANNHTSSPLSQKVQFPEFHSTQPKYLQCIFWPVYCMFT